MNSHSKQEGVSAIVTAYRRIQQTIDTIRRITEAQPAPFEVLVHVDGNQVECAAAVSAAYPEVRVFVSHESVGPGGGRNVLVAAARCECVVSFDDDSWPIEPDFFARAREYLEAYPRAAVLSCKILSPVQRELESQPNIPIRCFEGGGAILRRSALLQTLGYVPLRFAYGMEEVDLSFQLYDLGWEVRREHRLSVFHDSTLSHHATPEINAACIRNVGLLAFLRYPIVLWVLGGAQVASRVVYSLRVRRIAGVASGVLSIPSICWRMRHMRRPVRICTVFRVRRLSK